MLKGQSPKVPRYSGIYKPTFNLEEVIFLRGKLNHTIRGPQSSDQSKELARSIMKKISTGEPV